jgi:hypothetical protein
LGSRWGCLGNEVVERGLPRVFVGVGRGWEFGSFGRGKMGSRGGRLGSRGGGVASHVDFFNGCFPIKTLKRERECEK